MIVFILVLSISVSAQAQSAKLVPALKLKDLQGRKFRLADYKGKVVLLNFWATWCPPCRAEMPDLIRWQRDYRGRGLQVVGVTYPPTNLGEVLTFVRRIKTNYPIVLGSKETKTLFDDSETLPITVIIDSDQRIIETIKGILLPEEFEQKIKPLLRAADRTSNDSKKAVRQVPRLSIKSGDNK